MLEYPKLTPNQKTRWGWKLTLKHKPTPAVFPCNEDASEVLLTISSNPFVTLEIVEVRTKKDGRQTGTGWNVSRVYLEETNEMVLDTHDHNAARATFEVLSKVLSDRLDKVLLG